LSLLISGGQRKSLQLEALTSAVGATFHWRRSVPRKGLIQLKLFIDGRRMLAMLRITVKRVYDPIDEDDGVREQ